MLDGLPRQLWLTYWRAWQHYHRYTVEGLEYLDVPEARLIAGYHGRPLAFDMAMLTVALYDRLGYLPHGTLHRGVRYVPPMRWLARGLGFVITDGEELAAAVRRGEHIVVTPGGAEEGCRRFDDSYRVNWGERTGYVRLAVKYGLKIVPVGAAGADGGYIGLNSGPVLGRALGLPRDYSWIVWAGLGPLGLWPLSPPFPVRMYQLVGAPIDPRDEGAVSVADREALLRVHQRVTAAVQSLLDRARERLRRGAS
jgi:1-acyl-sn-glycerol-3-phosphate acyltransferase